MPSLNITHLRSIQGIVGLAEIVLQFVLIICLAIFESDASGYDSVYFGVEWFIVIVCLICVVTIFVCYLLKVFETFTTVPWGLINYGIITAFIIPHLILGIRSADLGRLLSPSKYASETIAIAVFHFASFAVFGTDSALYFMMLHRHA